MWNQFNNLLQDNRLVCLFLLHCMVTNIPTSMYALLRREMTTLTKAIELLYSVNSTNVPIEMFVFRVQFTTFTDSIETNYNVQPPVLS